jgi:hypothetical protein
VTATIDSTGGRHSCQQRRPAVHQRRTAKYHLHKGFTKLGISSRSQLDRVLPSEPATVQPPQ